MFLFAMAAGGKAEAAENVRGEVVFLLDASKSMNTQDREHAVQGAVRQAAYSLPSGYRAGVVAYGTKVQAVMSLEEDIRELDGLLEALRYEGYTNAGDGLEQALELFSGEGDIQRCIIMISDGEIDMPDAEGKEEAYGKYLDAAKQAGEKGIRILTVAIGQTPENSDMDIFDGTRLTGGAVYQGVEPEELSRVMEQIKAEEMGLPMQPIGVTDAGGGSIHVKIPEGASRTKILLYGDKTIKNVRAEYSAESGRTITGAGFAVVDMSRPYPGNAQIYFETEDIDSIHASILTEYTAKPQVAVEYRVEEIRKTEEEAEKDAPPRYGHYALAAIRLTDTETGWNLWEGEGMEGTQISYTLNGTAYTGTVQDGQICQEIPADGIDTIEVTVAMAKEGAVYYLEQPIAAEIIKYPDPEPEQRTDYGPLYAVLGMLAAATAVLLLWWAAKRKRTVIYMAPSPRGVEKKIETRNATYSGKLNIYVVQTQDGRDIPPQTYRLFGRADGRMSLDKVLSSCGIRFGKIGAGDIVFYPGQDRALIVMDQSERCTVMRGTEILKKGMGYPAYYNEKITVSFEDGITELEIHYRDLKPGER